MIHESRLVTLPQWQGFAIGPRLSEGIGQILPTGRGATAFETGPGATAIETGKYSRMPCCVASGLGKRAAASEDACRRAGGSISDGAPMGASARCKQNEAMQRTASIADEGRQNAQRWLVNMAFDGN